jgi:hypothetical protein
MGIDYAPSRRFVANEVLWLRRDEFAGAQPLAEGVRMASVDLAHADSADCDARQTCRITESGLCHGLLGWIRISLDGEWLSTHPFAPPVHWLPVLLPLDPALPLDKGEEVVVALHRPARGDWTWSLQARSGQRRHSSFLARAETPAALQRVAPDHRPGLGRDGARVLFVLELMRQGLSNRDIAARLAHEEGISPEDAMRRVRALALRYGTLP